MLCKDLVWLFFIEFIGYQLSDLGIWKEHFPESQDAIFIKLSQKKFEPFGYCENAEVFRNIRPLNYVDSKNALLVLSKPEDQIFQIKKSITFYDLWATGVLISTKSFKPISSLMKSSLRLEDFWTY